MSSSLDSTIALVTTTSMANILGIVSGGTEEVEMDLLINAASQWALDYTGRTSLVLNSSLTEYYDGDASTVFYTRARPINSVVSLYVDPLRSYGSDTLLASTDYVVYGIEGAIRTNTTIFTYGLQSIKLTYSAGYSTIPYNIQNAIKELVQFWYFRGTAHRVGLRSVNVGDKSTTYESEIPASVVAVMKRYVMVWRWLAYSGVGWSAS